MNPHHDACQTKLLRRKAVLAFDVSAPRLGAIELRIDWPGESTPRTFR